MPRPGARGPQTRAASLSSLAYSLLAAVARDEPGMLAGSATPSSLVVVARGDHRHVGEALGGLVHVHVRAVGDGVE